MNKDNFIANVRALKDFYNVDYFYEGKTLSDCRELTVGQVVITFSYDLISIKDGTFTGNYSYDEIAEAYSFLLYCLFGSVIELRGNSLYMKCNIGPFYLFPLTTQDDKVIVDICIFDTLYEAHKFLKQFVQSLMFNAYLSDPIQLNELPFTFQFYHKEKNYEQIKSAIAN